MTLLKHFVWLSILVTGLVHAADTDGLRDKLEALMPAVTVDSVEILDNSGLYEVVVNGGDVL